MYLVSIPCESLPAIAHLSESKSNVDMNVYGARNSRKKNPGFSQANIVLIN